MTTRLPAWRQDELWALLQAFREQVLVYVYASDEQFAACVQPALRGEHVDAKDVAVEGIKYDEHACELDRTTQQIMEAVRTLMEGFGVALSTKSFCLEGACREVTEATSDMANDRLWEAANAAAPLEHDGAVHKHLYETIAGLAENQRGGVWPPDELRRLLSKIQMYRTEFHSSPHRFFTRIQVWGAWCRG